MKSKRASMYVEQVPTIGVGVAQLMRSDRPTAMGLQNIQRQAVLRSASVQAHAMVQADKLRQIDHLVREASTGQALLQWWAATIAHGDPFLADECRFFTDLARIGKGEIIADTIAAFCQEGR